MRTEVYYRRKKSGRWVIFHEKTPGAKCHWAEWRVLTVGIWQDLELAADEQHAVARESATWKFLLLDSSLLRGIEKKHEGKVTSREAWEAIVKCTPAIIPKMLVTPAIQASAITMEEHDRIQRECMTLWVGDGSTVKKPHPLLGQAITGMMMSEKYGIPQYKDIREMPYREYLVCRLAAQNYGEIMKLNRQGQVNQAEAAKRAGIHAR